MHGDSPLQATFTVNSHQNKTHFCEMYYGGPRLSLLQHGYLWHHIMWDVKIFSRTGYYYIPLRHYFILLL
jgi:hypothetical protein